MGTGEVLPAHNAPVFRKRTNPMPSTEPAQSTTESPRRATRLSLYKLFLPTTVWVAMTADEVRRVRHWLRTNCSRTVRRNAVNDLRES